jgi:hypothetical protein
LTGQTEAPEESFLVLKEEVERVKEWKAGVESSALRRHFCLTRMPPQGATLNTRCEWLTVRENSIALTFIYFNTAGE